MQFFILPVASDNLENLLNINFKQVFFIQTMYLGTFERFAPNRPQMCFRPAYSLEARNLILKMSELGHDEQKNIENKLFHHQSWFQSL